MNTHLLAEAISLYRLLPLALFGAVAAGVWWLLDMMVAARPRAEERLDEFNNPQNRRKDGAAVKKSVAFRDMLAKASPRLAAPLQPKTAEEAGKLKNKLAMAGFRGENAVSVFLSLKFASLLVGTILGGGAALLGSQPTDRALINTVAAAGVMFYLPSIGLWFLTKRRKDSIFYGLPDALDLLVVCVEAGLGLDQAMRKVSEEMKKSCRTVAEEFGLCNFQLQMGRPRTEVHARKTSSSAKVPKLETICS